MGPSAQNRMGWPLSIRAYLAGGLFFFFVIVFLLGVFSIASLRYVNALSDDVGTRWLPRTGFIGDLNNFTSDFPAAERAALLALNANEVAAHTAEMAGLDRAIARTQKSYARLANEPSEAGLYARFAAQWRAYRGVVQQELALLQRNRIAALEMYRTRSQGAYNQASDTLGTLTDQVLAGSRDASARAAHAFNEAQILIVVAVVCAGLLMGGATILIKQLISNPLLELSASIRRLAANETDIEIHYTGRRDEIGELARAMVVFRDNAIDLAASQRGLAQQATMLQEKLAEEQRLASLQRNFVSMASHEFRTPLTTIDAHAQRLLKVRDQLGPDKFAERIGKIRSAVLRLTNLINGMLETSRMDETHAGLYFHPTEIDLAIILHEVCQFHREIAPRRIVEALDQQSLPLLADSRLLFQLFSNLLSNAIKYSPSEGIVEVDAQADEHSVTVAVRDHGIGIPEGDLPHLFERFYRGANASNIVGTGIGLYFVKTVVDLHGGEIWVESEEGNGSTFTVRLPVEPKGRSKSAPASQPATVAV